MIALGIDPGLTGAIAALRVGCTIPVLADMPVHDGARRIDGRALIHLLRTLAPTDDAVCVGLEAIHARPGFGLQSQEGLVRASEAVRVVLDILRWRVVHIPPARWKATYGLARRKGERPASWKGRHLDVARRLFPACPDLARARDHNRAEAVLIAHHIAEEHC